MPSRVGFQMWLPPASYTNTLCVLCLVYNTYTVRRSMLLRGATTTATLSLLCHGIPRDAIEKRAEKGLGMSKEPALSLQDHLYFFQPFDSISKSRSKNERPNAHNRSSRVRAEGEIVDGDGGLPKKEKYRWLAQFRPAANGQPPMIFSSVSERVCFKNGMSPVPIEGGGG